MGCEKKNIDYFYEISFLVQFQFQQLFLILAQQIMNKVMCYNSGERYTIQCGNDEIIDIKSVTIALYADWSPCTVDRLVPIFNSLTPPCKRSLRSDGAGVYSRYAIDGTLE